MNLVEYVFRAARKLERWPRPAILCEDRQLSYEELLRQVKKCGHAIQALGLKPEDRVAIVASDCPEFIIAFLGIVAVGSIAVPLGTMLTASELEYVLNHCGARAAIITSDQLKKLQSISDKLPQLSTMLLVDGEADEAASFNAALRRAGEARIEPVGDEALAFILYTSGSTGRPKGATHIHRNLPYTVETYCRHVLRVEPEDRLFSSSRLFFAYGLGNSLSFPLSSGATTILCRERPVPQVISRVFESQRPTIFFGVPAVFRALIEYTSQGNRLATESIKFCVSAGEKLPERIFYEWRELMGLEILDGIGSTEMLQMFISNRRDDIRAGSSGRVVPGYEAKIVEPSGREVAGAGEGNLMIKGLSAHTGYWMEPEKTAAAREDEWVRTGDIYRRDEDGFYWFEGRSDDMFKVKGMWVSPVEVEDALLASPQILEAAVVPRRDRDGMNSVVAFVVPKSKQTSENELVEELSSKLSELLPPYKQPAEFHFADALPRTATGKLQRFKLRDELANS